MQLTISDKVYGLLQRIVSEGDIIVTTEEYLEDLIISIDQDRHVLGYTEAGVPIRGKCFRRNCFETDSRSYEA
jgi:hypothetical protein